MLTVPPALLDILRVAARRIRRCYSLDELLAQCSAKARLSRDEREWLREEPSGRELI